jgi:hypothetical protein
LRDGKGLTAFWWFKHSKLTHFHKKFPFFKPRKEAVIAYPYRNQIPTSLTADFPHFQDTVSVHRPSFYAQRFQDFMAKTVFRKIPSRKFTLPTPNKYSMGHL